MFNLKDNSIGADYIDKDSPKHEEHVVRIVINDISPSHSFETYRNCVDSTSTQSVSDEIISDMWSFESLKRYERQMKAQKLTLENTSKVKKNYKFETAHYNCRNVYLYVLHTIQDMCAAFYIYFQHALTLEGFIIILNVIFATNVHIFFSSLEIKLDFSLLGFAIVFPLTFLMQQVFTRREQSLVHISEFKVLLQTLTSAYFTWSFANPSDKTISGRNTLEPMFNANVRNISYNLIELLYQYLSLPIVGKARHFLFPSEKREFHNVALARNEIECNFALAFQELNNKIELLKAHGLTSSEASRLYQYTMLLQQRLGFLRNMKIYRTPYATRSFGRVYLLVLPYFFGPYFNWVAGPDRTIYSHIFAVVLAVFTFMILLGLMNASRFLEDSFVRDGFDNVHLKHELAVLRQNIEFQFSDAEKKRSGENENSMVNLL